MSWQNAIVYLLVALCACYALLKLRKTSRGGCCGANGCGSGGGCEGCGHAESTCAPTGKGCVRDKSTCGRQGQACGRKKLAAFGRLTR